MTYRAPIREITFARDDVVALDWLRGFARFSDCDGETTRAVLDAAGAFAADVLAPLNRTGDIEGSRFENGCVRAPSGFAAAYGKYVEAGWGALSASTSFGGQGLPRAIDLAVFEMIHASNMAFGLCPMLTRGAIEALTVHGTARQKQIYLPKLVSSEWSGTMNLTEPDRKSTRLNSSHV